MGSRSPSPSLSGTRFIFTTTARIDASALRLWPLLADTPGWPRWWTAVARSDKPPAQRRRWPRTTWLGRWRVAAGWPLHLAVDLLASQPQEWLTLRLQGDLQGQATFMLQGHGTTKGSLQHGLALTCRCELQDPRPPLWAGAAGLEHRMHRLMQTLVRDLGRALQCRSVMLGHWQGSSWRG
jgi:uncharacterized protein YndB with AHSA1/START domain